MPQFAHIKVHVLSNKKTLAMLGPGVMTPEIFEQIRLDTGISKENKNSVIRCMQGVTYVIEGHTSDGDIYNLLNRDELAEGLRVTLAHSLAFPEFDSDFVWMEAN